MSERDRERRYWTISLVLIAVSPLVIYQLSRVHFSFSFSLFLPFIVLVLSIPLTVLVDALLTKILDPTSPPRFWIVKPTEEMRHLHPLPIENSPAPFKNLQERTQVNQIVEQIESRLTGFGFEQSKTSDANSIVIAFQKAKSDPILAFIDHAMFGEVRIRLFGAAIEVLVWTTFNDTLVIETGEFERLRGLCSYLSLESGAFTYKTVPLSVYCGLNLAFVTSIVATATYFFNYPVERWLTSLSVASAGILVASLFLMQKKREHLFGYRLMAAGMYLAAVPVLSVLVDVIRLLR